MIGRRSGGSTDMRVSTGQASRADNRMFSVIVESFGIGRQRRSQRTLTVPFERLQSLMQTIAKQGGRIVSINDAEVPAAGADADSVVTDPAAAAPAASTPAPSPKVSPNAHADVPVKIGRAHV